MKLRDYQQECLNSIPESGRHVIVMATGLGKTVTFAGIPRRGRMLILSHRDELVRQPLKYFDPRITGIEQAELHAGNAEVVSASVQTLTHRYKNFAPDAFDTVIVDECHHSAAKSYRTLTDYFKPRLLLGFTATPNRADGVGLSDIFDDIIFERDLEWGIKHGWLSNIRAMRVDVGYDLRDVAVRLGDYSPEELDKAVNIESANKAVADAYRLYAHGQTIIFCVSVDHAKKLAAIIPNAEYVIGGEDRTDKLERFKRGETKCLTNCMVLTEGTDLPMIETVMIARPTQNQSLYVQMVGRGTRLYEGKVHLTLIDLCGASSVGMCSAPTLVGADAELLDREDRVLLDGDLFDLPDIVQERLDTPKYWIKNVELINLWAKRKKYNLHGVNYFRMATGTLVLSKPRIRIDAPNKLGQIYWKGQYRDYQHVLDDVYTTLCRDYSECRQLWDISLVKKWGDTRATDRQMEIINSAISAPLGRITKAEAAEVITRLYMGRNL